MHIQCYPNPTTSFINIQYSITEEQSINISLYNIYGILLYDLFNGDKNRGTYCERYNLSTLPDGTYFIQFNSKKQKFAYKIIKN